jgi:hypothetical protein
LITVRWSRQRPPRRWLPGSSGASCAHALSVSSPRPTTSWLPPPAQRVSGSAEATKCHRARHALVAGNSSGMAGVSR